MPIPRPCVVDTNVAVVANGNSPQADGAMVKLCIDALREITLRGGLVLDSTGEIFGEYARNLRSPGQPGAGYIFMKWVSDNQWNSDFCELRTITAIKGKKMFVEFPDGKGLEDFDPSDRKFVAVANAGKKRQILQAVDFKWWRWKDALAEAGIQVVFLDENAARAGYNKKHAKRT